MMPYDSSQPFPEKYLQVPEWSWTHYMPNVGWPSMTRRVAVVTRLYLTLIGATKAMHPFRTLNVETVLDETQAVEETIH